MKNKKIILAASIVAVLAIVGIGLWVLFSKDKESSDENVVYVNEVTTIMNPGSGNGSINRFAGVVETQKKIDIQPAQDREVKEILVEEGQTVQVGTVLFTYDTEKTQESLDKAKLELERIDNNIENKKSEIAALEKEKRGASSDAQLDYTMQIQGAQMELKQGEYEKKGKQVEIDKLNEALENAQVTSEMDGVVKKINATDEPVYYGESQAFMTIIAMGDYRIKGKINEQNMGSIIPGEPVIVHSRIDDSVIWHGVMGEVDTQNPGNDSNNYYYSSGDSTTQSNSYPFYVELDSSEGLMLGQHVYIEADRKQEEKLGIWLDAYFICDAEGDAYVWADNGKGKLVKKKVVLGQFDENLYQYEIADGLSETDLISWPEEGLKEGMHTARGENGQMGQSSPAISDDMMMDQEMMDGEIPSDEQMSEDIMSEDEMEETP